MTHSDLLTNLLQKKIHRRYRSQQGKPGKAAVQQAGPALTAGEPPRHGPGPGPQQPLQSPALLEPSVESKNTRVIPGSLGSD